MFRKCLLLVLGLSFGLAAYGCAEKKDIKVHREEQSQTESEPQDVDQGTMIVE